MELWTIRKEIEVDAPAERVWPYVATQNGYTRWSCTIAEVYDVVLEERVGGRYEERGVVKGEAWVNVGKVLVYDPPHTLAFTFQTRRSDGSLSPEMTVTIRLFDIGGRTRVILEHSGLDRLPPEHRAAKFRSFDEGWAHALEVLLTILVQELPPAQGYTIRKEIEIDASADRVWRYVATQEGLRQWWDAPNLILEEHASGRLESHGVHNGLPHRHIGTVLTYEPPHRLVLTWREDMADGSFWPADTIITITLAESAGRTRVTVEHNFEPLPAELRERMLNAYRTGWTDDLMGRLRALATGRAA